MDPSRISALWNIKNPERRIIYFFSGPFYVPEDADNSRVEKTRLYVEEHMRDMAMKAARYWKDEETRRQFPEPDWARK